ncbi:MAG: (2Fe-2S) ferredoxin domain-containing protein [Rubrobacter sp.]|nr:(2Fe-2S) ferredoxin domain-containing protein [Rubrobacter sp.]
MPVIGNGSQLLGEGCCQPGNGVIIAKKNEKDRGKSSGIPSLLGRNKPDAKVRDYDAQIFVCKDGDCKKRGSKEVRKALKDELRSAGMNGDVRVDSVECLGLCKHGPNAIVYPGGVWYLGLIEDDVPEIVESHLKGGDPVERLTAEFRPRKKRKK